MQSRPSDAPEFFPHGPSPLARFVALGLLSLLLMFVDHRYRYLERVRSAVASVLAPVQRAAAVPGEVAAGIAGYFRDQRSLLEENDALSRQLLAQSAAVQGHRSLVMENTGLRRLLDLRAQVPATAVAAEVLYAGRDPFRQRLVIDKGERDGVDPGMAVIDDRGVMGQVTRVLATTAEVTLVTDKDHAVPVQIERSGVRTVLNGAGVGRPLELRFLPINADVLPGDRLVTSGMDGVYPAGLLVAVVSAVNRDPARMFAGVLCSPVAGIDRSRRVMALSVVPPEPGPEDFEVPEASQRAATKGRRG